MEAAIGDGTFSPHEPGSIMEAYFGPKADLLHLPPRFRELDRDGGTAQIWRELCEKRRQVLVDVGLLPADLEVQPDVHPQIGAGKPGSSSKRQTGIPKAEATILVRQYLKSNPNASIRDVNQATGVSTGAITKLATWQAHKAARHMAAAKNMRSPAVIRLTGKMLKVIGRPGEVLTGLEAVEVVCEYIRDRATPKERQDWDRLSDSERVERIRVVVAQLADDARDEPKE
jgi:hypothetical protein